MKEFLKKLLWLAVFAGFVYGGYLLYKRWWDKDAVTEKASSVIQKSGVKVKTTTGSWLDDLTERFVKQPIEKIKDYSKQTAFSAASSLEKKLETAVSSLKDKKSTSESERGIEQSKNSKALLSAAITSSTVVKPTATILAQKGDPLMFSISSGKQNVSYKIHWGDENIEEGVVSLTQDKTLSHRWFRAGDYLVKINIQEGKEINTYSFPVHVNE